MKKISLLFCALCALAMTAKSEVVDGINYEIITDTTVQIITNDPAYSGDIVIPASVNIEGKDYQVTSLGFHAFLNCEELTSVVLPNTIQEIDNEAFRDCHKLAKINFPEGLTYIGDDAFWNCYALDSVVLPSTIKTINSYAFEACKSLKYFYLPNGLEYLGAYVFLGDSALTEPIMNDSVLAYVPYSYTSYTVPEGIKALSEACFYQRKELTSITLPSTMEAIYYQAFAESGLTSIVIPDNVTYIFSSAFSGCRELTSVTFGENLAQIGSDAFGDCSLLTNITWSTTGVSNLKIIEGGAFTRTGLTSVTVPEGVEYLNNYYGRGAFANCANLTTVSLPSTVIYIASNTFKNCPITSITIDAANTTYDTRDNCNAIIHTESNTLILGFATSTIPASVTDIGESAFEGCQGLTSITIPEGVTYIGGYAFTNCSNLASISLPNSLRRAGYNIIGYTAIEGIVNTPYVFIRMPKTDPAATGEYTVPNGTEQIAGLAFYECENLTAIHLPASLKIISDDAFWNCSNITEMVIPDNVDTILDYAFDNMTAMTKLTLPANLKYIGSYPLSSCNNLKEIICPAEVPAESYPWEEIIGGDLDDPGSIKLYVPDLSVDAYKAAWGWRVFDVQPMSQIPTGIEQSQESKVKSQKTLRNGQLLIERDGRVYNVLGVEVNE
jgi:hypothetical protein